MDIENKNKGITDTLETSNSLITPSQKCMKELTQVNFSAIILAAGDFPSHPLPLHLLQKAQNLVVCDGALSGLIELGIEPTAVVGDGDSLTEDLKARYSSIYHHISEQEIQRPDQSNSLCTFTHEDGCSNSHTPTILLSWDNWETRGPYHWKHFTYAVLL